MGPQVIPEPYPVDVEIPVDIVRPLPFHGAGPQPLPMVEPYPFFGPQPLHSIGTPYHSIGSLGSFGSRSIGSLGSHSIGSLGSHSMGSSSIGTPYSLGSRSISSLGTPYHSVGSQRYPFSTSPLPIGLPL